MEFSVCKNSDLYMNVCVIGGSKGGTVGLQPHLILRMFHRTLIFAISLQ